MKKVYLHVGKHKTGTTSIQRFLSHNKNALIESGFFPLSNNETRDFLGFGYSIDNEMNNVNFSHSIIRNTLITPMRYMSGDLFAERNRLEIAKSLNYFLQEINHETIIISAESFSFLRDDEEKILYEIAFSGLHLIPIFFTRDHESWMRSWKIQIKNIFTLERAGYEQESIFDYSENSWLLDDEAIIRFFDNPMTVDYEKSMDAHGSVIIDFINCLGLNPDSFDKLDFFENRSKDKLVSE